MITVRHAIGWAAVVATVPYLALKTIWLAGGTVGVVDVDAFGEPSAFVLNAVTAGMDVVAILVALLFTCGWRVPGLLVLVPIWVGTGFLVPIAVMVPGMDFSAPQSFLEPWVQPLVYGGFAFQGLMLAIAFVFYARERWAYVFLLDTADIPAAGVVRLLAGHVGVLLAAAAAVRYLAGGDFVFGAFALAAAAGSLVITHRVRGRFWVPVAAAWVGAGSLFAWGSWSAVNALAETFLARNAPVWPPLLDLAGGALIGLTSLSVFAGLRRANTSCPCCPVSRGGRTARP